MCVSDYVPVYVCVCCRLVSRCPREVALRGQSDQFEVRDLLHLSFSSSSHHSCFSEASFFQPLRISLSASYRRRGACVPVASGVARLSSPVLNHLYSSCQTLPFELLLYYLRVGRSGAGIADSVLIQGQLM